MSRTSRRFIADVLEGPDAAMFLKDFLTFQREVARVGIVHSLSQALLKFASPGVPDIVPGLRVLGPLASSIPTTAGRSTTTSEGGGCGIFATGSRRAHRGATWPASCSPIPKMAPSSSS